MNSHKLKDKVTRKRVLIQMYCIVTVFSMAL